MPTHSDKYGDTTEVLKHFVMLAMKTMFKRGASGSQIRTFLENYLPDQDNQYAGNHVKLALEDLQQEGSVERRGIRWCLVAI